VAPASNRELEREGILVRVIDAYSIKPIAIAIPHEAGDATGALFTVKPLSGWRLGETGSIFPTAGRSNTPM